MKGIERMPERIIPKLKKIPPGPTPKSLIMFVWILYPGIKRAAIISPIINAKIDR